MDADVRRFSLPLDSPLSTAEGTIAEREGFLVRVTAEGDDGPVGLGEATPLPGWTGSVAACRAALSAATERLGGEGPAAALASLRGAPAARHGLQVALADHAARQAGRPLAGTLGEDAGGPGADLIVSDSTPGDDVDPVPVNATVGDGSPADTADAAREAVDAGFDCVKVKVGGRDAAADTARLGAVRDAVGPGPTLRADANGAWTRAQAYEAVRNYPTADVAVVEQPLDPGDLRGHAGLREQGIDVALDESVVTAGVESVLDARAADVVVLKPMALGGLDRAREAALAALDRGVDVVVSNTVDAVVARTAAGHLAASLPAVRPCGLATADRLADDLATDPAPVVDGAMAVPDEPGTGVDVAAAWAAATAEVEPDA